MRAPNAKSLAHVSCRFVMLSANARLIGPCCGGFIREGRGVKKSPRLGWRSRPVTKSSNELAFQVKKPHTIAAAPARQHGCSDFPQQGIVFAAMAEQENDIVKLEDLFPPVSGSAFAAARDTVLHSC